MILCLIIGMVAGYLLGSINFAIIITGLFGKGDIRTYGSGNAGMTNVLRSIGKGAAALTLVGDFSKGIIAVIFARILLFHLAGVQDFFVGDYLVAYAALLGHAFPLYYGFKGGKGILVSAGALLILSPLSFCICVGAFLILTTATKYVSVGSIAAAVTYPLANLWVVDLQSGHIGWMQALLALPITFLIIYLHRANIKRLANGTESKITFKKRS